MTTSCPEADENEPGTGEGVWPKARLEHRWIALVALCLSVVIVNVDNTILNVALPTLVLTLHATSSQLQWIIDSYAMALAGMLLVGGSLGDRFGRKRLFMLGLALFLAGSIGAAFSHVVVALIAFRAVMGAGAALTMPSTLSIINDTFRTPRDRARAISAWAGSSGLGIAIGPVAGGLLLSRFWWGSVFLVNVPIVVLAVGGALLLVRDSRNVNADRPDPGGSALSIVGLGLLLWAIIEAPTEGWGSPIVIGVGLASIATLGAFVWWEARSDHPMLKLAFFRDRRFAIAAAAECLGVFGLFGGLFVQTQFLQFKLGYSPLQAGLRILPVAAAVVVSSPLAVIAVRFAGAKITAAAGLAAIAGGLWQASAASTVGATYGAVLPGMLIVGVGAGLLLSTATNSLVGSLPQQEAGVGSAANGVSIQVGGALGVAVIGSVLATRYQDRMGNVLATQHVPSAIGHQITGSVGGALGVAERIGGATGAKLADAAKAAFMSGTQTSLAVGACTALAGVLLTLWLLPSRPARPEAAAEAETQTGSETATQNESAPEAGTGNGPEAETDTAPEVKAENESETAAAPEAEAEAEAEAKTQTDTAPEAETENESETATNPETKTTPERKPKTRTAPETTTGTETAPEPKPGAVPETATAANPETETAPEPKPETGNENENENGTGTAPAPKPGTENEPALRQKQRPKPSPNAGQKTRPTPKTKQKTKPGASPKPSLKPNPNPSPKPQPGPSLSPNQNQNQKQKQKQKTSASPAQATKPMPQPPRPQPPRPQPPRPQPSSQQPSSQQAPGQKPRPQPKPRSQPQRPQPRPQPRPQTRPQPQGEM